MRPRNSRLASGSCCGDSHSNHHRPRFHTYFAVVLGNLRWHIKMVSRAGRGDFNFRRGKETAPVLAWLDKDDKPRESGQPPR